MGSASLDGVPPSAFGISPPEAGGEGIEPDISACGAGEEGIGPDISSCRAGERGVSPDADWSAVGVGFELRESVFDLGHPRLQIARRQLADPLQ